MRKKIVIIGAIGYLGTELCKIYSGESWKNEVIALDSRFVSHRVNQLKEWNIKYFQGSILDRNYLKKHITNADIVYHLAGVTDVAYTKSQTNSILDKKIKSIAIDGTNNVLKFLDKKSKIIFPSTHVVFEGFKKVKKNITEKEKPKPILTYSTSKVQNEEDIKKSKKNFIILRLGSVYGYSGDTMRINIMPNLFSKIASQNGKINLFGGGVQFKSLVSVIDVVRCLKFMGERDDINNEIFHLTNEQMTVKQIAEICKKINPSITLTKTNDEIPNKGYTLSNKKLLKTGFKFLYNIKQSIEEMIKKWKFSEKNKHLEYVYGGANEFVDKRGKISNYELPESINLIGYITSKKGTLRANHFHPVQEQKCLLVKGQFISVYKDLLDKNSNKITHVVNEGDMIVTKPNVAHTMMFSKNSVFLNLVRGEREHHNYGITHTMPYKLIDNEEVLNLIKFYKFECRVCGNNKLKRFISLGFQPLANNLINSKNQKVDKYPLEINFCEECYNSQLSVSISSNKMFSNYLYLSSTNQTFVNHFEKAASKYIKKLKLKKNSFVLDIGSNDGIGLYPFKKYGFNNLLGIEPAKNLCKFSSSKGIKTLNEFFNKNTIRKINKKADLILASNVFAHSDNLLEMAETMLKILSNKGTIIIEVQYLLKMFKDLTFDNIYHEHYNYWCLTSLKNLFNKLNAIIYDVEEIDTHGGSIRIYVSKNIKIKTKISVKTLLKKEEKFGMKSFQTYKSFGKKIYEIKQKTIKNINKLKLKNKNIIGFGAPAKATTLLNFFGISDKLDYVVEDNNLKHNKYIPGTNLKIFKKSIVKDKDSAILVLAWNFFNDIKKNNKNLSNNFINIKNLQK